MFVFDLTNPLTLVLMLAATILFIFLSQEVKRGLVAAIPLFAFIIDLVIHTMQVVTLKDQYSDLYSTLCINMAIDFVFVFLTFIAYLWADEVESKERHIKSIDNSLDWLWKKV